MRVFGRRRARLTDEQKAERAARQAAHDATKKECQICERHQCVNARGKMVLHGYERPGHGFIKGSCFGVGHVDYATGTDALEAYATTLKDMLVAAKDSLGRFDRGEVVRFTTLEQERAKDERGRTIYDGRKPRLVPWLASWAPGVSDAEQYGRLLASKHQDARTRVEQLGDELGRVHRRIAAWVAP